MDSQQEFWNGPAAQRWVREQARLDCAFAVLTQQVLDRAAPQPGERVVDVGCGCGTSTVALADRVGASGSVLGVDISAPMLEVARTRLADRPWAAGRVADAQTAAFAGDADLIFSRFGVMFFEQPEVAFTNLRRALRPGGRLCVVCWRAVAENLWYRVPLAAAEAVAGPLPSTPGGPGPFSLADADHTRRLLAQAGFQVPELRPLDVMIELSTEGLDEAVTFAIQAGPVSRLLQGATPDVVAKVRAAIAVALAPHAEGPVVALPAAVWIVEARA